MRKGLEIHGFTGIDNADWCNRRQYHLVHNHRNNRAYLCGCMRSIFLKNKTIWCSMPKGKLKNKLFKNRNF